MSPPNIAKEEKFFTFPLFPHSFFGIALEVPQKYLCKLSLLSLSLFLMFSKKAAACFPASEIAAKNKKRVTWGKRTSRFFFFWQTFSSLTDVSICTLYFTFLRTAERGEKVNKVVGGRSLSKKVWENRVCVCTEHLFP